MRVRGRDAVRNQPACCAVCARPPAAAPALQPTRREHTHHEGKDARGDAQGSVEEDSAQEGAEEPVDDGLGEALLLQEWTGGAAAQALPVAMCVQEQRRMLVAPMGPATNPSSSCGRGWVGGASARCVWPRGGGSGQGSAAWLNSTPPPASPSGLPMHRRQHLIRSSADTCRAAIIYPSLGLRRRSSPPAHPPTQPSSCSPPAALVHAHSPAVAAAW